MAGRKPKPTNLRVLQGNPGKRPINKNEPKPKGTKPRCPTHLDDEAKREWKRMAKKLHSAGLLTEVDKAALAAYCTCWSRWVDAETKLRKHGAILLSPDKGWPVQSPYLSVANKAMAEMRKWLVEFGMTPSSRSRIQVPDSSGEEDPFEEWLRGNRSTG